MTDHLLNVHIDVLASMHRGGPKHFAKLAFVHSEEHDPADTDLVHFRDRLLSADSGDELTALWRRTLTAWDFAENPSWSNSPARTDDRRADAYNRLGFGADLRKALDSIVPVFKEPGPVVISREFQPWYSREGAAGRSFYWRSYEKALRQKGWSDAAVSTLDQASHSVVERLSDPTREEPYGARGLVVGYVQSGKTANFTGVIAKAIDAGYRLVIVLGGTLNLLRAQTQRRLDMELIGQENILRGADPTDLDALVGIDYQDDEDWPHKFVSHDGRPSMLGSFDIERLTTRDDDYRKLLNGIRTLEFEKHDRARPLYDPANLHDAAARVMVVKKNKSVLTNLVKDLRKIGPLLSEIPALIIDDESDQASVNTTDPKKWEAGKVSRTAINGLISDLLKLLPRAQYVGYTATPFANVFVDPGDGDDIFPRDFLISLPRPSGYMGVQDFHDLDNPEGTAEEIHVRGILEDTGDRLQEAMDAFLLTGALKLYRADQGVADGPFRHHTMLVHESVRMDDHADLALRINTMWHQAGYTGPEGHARLEGLLASDFQRYADDGLPVPASYADLKPYVSRARQLINSGGNPVIVVNGDTDRYFSQIDLDFDRTPNVWKILVGGTKLSRGFTVEGLTVTYYRRTTQQADTLMQMGRWFGFRPGYRDLVRLYIGREEQLTKTRTADLYEAFEAICRDEELFRAELARYAPMVDGRPQVTPAQIPPLVAQHLSWMKPAARNKMFNAELVEVRSPGRPIEPAAYPFSSKAIARNTQRWQPVLAALSGTNTTCHLLPDDTTPLPRSFRAAATVVPHADLLGILSALEWEDGNVLAPHLTYLSQLDGRLAKVDDWLVMAPHRTEHHRIEATVLGHGPFSLFRRTRQAGKAAFSRISGLEHRAYAQQLIDQAELERSEEGVPRLGPHRGVVLLYPVVEARTDAEVREAAATGKADASDVIMAFTVIPPLAAIDSKRQLVRFRAKDSSRPDAAIVNSCE
ncbi:Z1 domain-containing protein [Streptomyces himalayensis]|uniref:Z1 domain-containing protein n=1 Tax=Streptomyces himalayensis subsp. himalayensis TaxID=2756131 RepID=A0A7W0DSS7_9ACTN|nr:Z1 domain-containing protein [Streptomyces himalayensis]MBA2949734.1 Z1 domain-containing protein [Streptomyces himalayensis subsp. himalayensis]